MIVAAISVAIIAVIVWAADGLRLHEKLRTPNPERGTQVDAPGV